MPKIVLLTDTHWGYSDVGDRANEALLDNINRDVPRPFTVLHTGDIGSHEPWHTRDYFRMLRNKFPNEEVGACLGNHGYWTYTKIPSVHGVQDVVDITKEYFEEFGIQYLPEQPLEREGVFITSFNGWYHDIYVNREPYIPHFDDPADGRQKLSRLAYQGFNKCLVEVEQAKQKGLKTILCTHFGSIKSASELDYKSQGSALYFGANPSWEDHLDNVDYYFFGHSHVAFDGFAKNGKTRVLNAGSDYEDVKYKVIEL